MADISHINLALLQTLSDGRFYSGEWLADQAGCTRSAVWKQIQLLREIPGIQIDAVTGRGYRLREPLALLDQTEILRQLSEKNSPQLEQCDVLAITESTNTLAAQQAPSLNHARAWFAEYQTAGRGRRGRQWLGGFARHLQFSLAYQFELPMRQLTGLSIAVGAVIMRVLTEQGVRNVGLKWPNDLLCEGEKLAGILVEVNGEMAGPSTAIIGIGLNVSHDPKTVGEIEHPITSLQALGYVVDRNQLAGAVLDQLLALCRDYVSQGLQPYLATWREHDVYQGKKVALVGPNQTIFGTQMGLADDGGVLLEIDGKTRAYYAGEISLRAVPDQ